MGLYRYNQIAYETCRKRHGKCPKQDERALKQSGRAVGWRGQEGEDYDGKKEAETNNGRISCGGAYSDRSGNSLSPPLSGL